MKRWGRILRASILASLILALALGAVASFILPQALYYRALNHGLETDYFSVPKYPPHLYRGQTLDVAIPPGFEAKNEGGWQEFPMERFLVPLPVRNSLYKIIPTFQFLDLKSRMGLAIISQAGTFYNSFRVGGPQRPQIDLSSDKIFQLPIFQNYIESKSMETIWRDLYEKNIAFPKKEGDSWHLYLRRIRRLQVKEMVYNVFLLKTRRRIFDDKVLSFGHIPKLGIAMAQLKSQRMGRKLEKLSFFSEGRIHSYYLETNLNKDLAAYLRGKIINETTYENMGPDRAIALHARFQNLGFQQKIDQLGMVHLFSAWGLDGKKEKFFKQMIHYLERGGSNWLWLAPLYKYAKKHYGTTFSLQRDRLREKEMRQEAGRIRPVVDEFSSDEQKARAFLQKAKDKVGGQRQKKEGVLVID